MLGCHILSYPARGLDARSSNCSCLLLLLCPGVMFDGARLSLCQGCRHIRTCCAQAFGPATTTRHEDLTQTALPTLSRVTRWLALPASAVFSRYVRCLIWGTVRAGQEQQHFKEHQHPQHSRECAECSTLDATVRVEIAANIC
jgi:hypothetical protein